MTGFECHLAEEASVADLNPNKISFQGALAECQPLFQTFIVSFNPQGSARREELGVDVFYRGGNEIPERLINLPQAT